MDFEKKLVISTPGVKGHPKASRGHRDELPVIHSNTGLKFRGRNF